MTGSAGELGKYVTKELIENGYEVVGTDLRLPGKLDYKFILSDLTDLGQVHGCMVGADAVIHLGAIRSPGGQPNEIVFGNNVLSTFNVLEAAANLGLKKVVFASSINVLGFGFATKYFLPKYMPIEEYHPLLPQDCYGLSKVVGEEICAACTRRTGMPTISLRFMWITYSELYSKNLPVMWKDPANGRSSLWSYIDGRDAANSCRLSLEAEVDGHEAFFIAAEDTYMKIPTMDLIRDFLPEISDFRRDIPGTSSIFDCSKAKRLLSFHPAYHWKDHFNPS